MSSTEQLLKAGTVGRAHGLDGSFYVRQPLARLLTKGTVVKFETSEAVIVRRSGTDAQPIIRLEGIETREDAEILHGKALQVAVTETKTLGDDEYWEEDLLGCKVVDGAENIGTVTRLIALPSCEVLEVELQSNANDAPTELILVPMVKDAIRSIDISLKKIDIDRLFLGLEAQQEPKTEN